MVILISRDGSLVGHPSLFQYRSLRLLFQPSIIHMPGPTGSLNREDIRIETLSIVPTSDYSTNYTETGLVGAGRTLGILYSYTGRRLEKAVGRVAHRAGLGPHATHLKIQQLLRTEWKTDNYTST